MSDAPTADGPPAQLRSGSVGAAGITFFVIAAAAPLTCVVGITPLSVAFGLGPGTPLAYLVTGVVLAVFAVGYVTMSRHIPSPGAFYAYIAHGIGRSIGMGAGLASVVAYLVGMAGLAAFAGFSLSSSLASWFGWDVPWFVSCLVIMALTTAMSISDISLGALVLGTLMVLEVAILLVLGVAILVQGGPSGLSFDPLSPSALTTGGLGISLAFAYASFIGFEQTAIYVEEARDAHRSIPRATYGAVAAISVFYLFVSWTLVLAYGVDGSVTAAQKDPAGFVFIATGTYLGDAWTEIVNALIVTSSFAAVLAFHNANARYLFALGRDRLLPAVFTRTDAAHGAPRVAALTVGAVVVGALAVCSAAGLDPFLDVFAWTSAAAAVGLIMLQATCSVAVVGFFRRSRADTRPWHTVVAPLLGFVALAVALVMIIDNLHLLVGKDTGAAGVLIPGGFAAVAAAGTVYGMVVRRRSPDRHAAFASARPQPSAQSRAVR